MGARAFPLAVGDIVAGKFLVERTIGAGGMGQVVAARHQQLGTTVAIKVIHATEANDPHAVTRFRREALAIARLKSEHVVRIYDIGETASGAPFMIMEYLEGRDLGSLLIERGPLPILDAVAYLLQGCDALIEAHDAGIFHRDIKPQNLFLAKRSSGESTIRVLDFGLAKGDAFRSDLKLTAPGDIIGTLQYMAPEQILGGTIDARTDVWGMGACLYRLLTRAYPFASAGGPDLFASILGSAPTPLRQQRPEIPPRVEAVVARCLRRDPSERFANMRELADALQSCVSNEPDTQKNVALASTVTTTQVDTIPELARGRIVDQPTPKAAKPTDLATTLALHEGPIELPRAKPALAAATLQAAQSPFELARPTSPQLGASRRPTTAGGWGASPNVGFAVTQPLSTVPGPRPSDRTMIARARTAPGGPRRSNAQAILVATGAAIVLGAVILVLLPVRARMTTAAVPAIASSSIPPSSSTPLAAPPSAPSPPPEATAVETPALASAPPSSPSPPAEATTVETPALASAPPPPVTSVPTRVRSPLKPKATTAPKKSLGKGDDPYESL